jgi:DNA-binding NarL/FixJ family response regulator
MFDFGKMNIVLADDSELVRERLARILTEDPNLKIVGQAGKSIEALSIIKDKQPDAVILDIRMPGNNGIEVLKRIKKYNPNTIVFILTNYHDNQYKAKCLKSGADYFFDKSEDHQLIANVLSELASKQLPIIFN